VSGWSGEGLGGLLGAAQGGLAGMRKTGELIRVLWARSMVPTFGRRLWSD
jgi:hypothetical protein